MMFLMMEYVLKQTFTWGGGELKGSVLLIRSYAVELQCHRNAIKHVGKGHALSAPGCHLMANSSLQKLFFIEHSSFFTRLVLNL